MKSFPISLAAASLIWASATTAQTQIASDTTDYLSQPRSNTQWQFSDKISKEFDTSLPHLEGRDFQMLHLGFGSSFHIGCDGVGDLHIDRQMTAEMKSLVNYVKSHALGLAINFLIYESPTLYSIYEHLQTLKQFNIDQSLVSCSSIRQLATEHREAEIRATDKCNQDGNTKEDCKDSGVLARYLDQAINDENRARSDATNGQGQNPTDLLAYAIEGNSETELELRAWLADVLPYKQTNDGSISVTAPKKTVGDYMDQYSKRYRDLLKSVVDTPAAQRSGCRALLELEAERAQKRITPETIMQMEEHKKHFPARYSEELDLFGKQMAMADVHYKITQTKLLLERDKVMVQAKALTQDDREYLSDAISFLQAQYDLYEVRYDNALRQYRIEAAVGTP